MTQGKKWGIFALVSLIIIGGGLYAFYKKNLDKLSNLKISARNVKVKGNFKKLTGSGKLQIDNPSEIKAQIDSYNIDIFVEGIFVANLTNNQANMSLPSNSSVVFPFTFSVDVAKFTANLLSLVMAVFVERTSDKPIKIRYKGTISGKHGVITLADFPVDYTYDYFPSGEPE